MGAPTSVCSKPISRASRKPSRPGWRRSFPPLAPPACETWTKAHGRLEHRRLWRVEAGELGPYLAREFGWPDVQQVGWVRRRWRPLSETTWRGEETRLWITNVPSRRAGPATLARLLRGHWTIENPVHWVRDVSCHEDRGHGRAVGVALATLRNAVINVL